jgi:two-component system invasion response regulator UvrY
LCDRPVHYTILEILLADGNIFHTQKISEFFQQTGILVYSMSPENIYARRLLQKGIRGYLSKQCDIEELEKAIGHLLRGEIYLSPWVKNALPMDPTSQPENPLDLLSRRELQVAEYLVAGLDVKVIARRMNLNHTTIGTYRKRTFRKLDVQNISELQDVLLLYKMQ